MNFAEALQALYSGKAITRPGINGIVFQKETKAGKIVIKSMHFKSDSGHEKGWLPKQGDIYTEEWRIV